MKEIEVLVEVYDDIKKVKKALKKFEYKGNKVTIDEYYYDPLRDTLKPDKDNQLSHCLRLRKKNDECSCYWTYQARCNSAKLERNCLYNTFFKAC